MKKIFTDFVNITNKDIKSHGVNSNSVDYSFHEDQSNKMVKQATKMIEACFKSLPMDSKMNTLINNKNLGNKNNKVVNNPNRILISQPTFTITSNKVNIHLFYYTTFMRKSMVNKEVIINNQKQFKSTMNILSKSLSILFRKEVNLSLTKLHYPYLNATILAKYLAHNSRSNTFVHYQNAILTYPSFYIPAGAITAYISGIKIQVAGRLMTERIIPRVSKKSASYGSFANAPVVDFGKVTMKNYLGTFTIKVWIANRIKDSALLHSKYREYIYVFNPLHLSRGITINVKIYLFIVNRTLKGTRKNRTFVRNKPTY